MDVGQDYAMLGSVDGADIIAVEGEPLAAPLGCTCMRVGA